MKILLITKKLKSKKCKTCGCDFMRGSTGEMDNADIVIDISTKKVLKNRFEAEEDTRVVIK